MLLGIVYLILGTAVICGAISCFLDNEPVLGVIFTLMSVILLGCSISFLVDRSDDEAAVYARKTAEKTCYPLVTHLFDGPRDDRVYYTCGSNNRLRSVKIK